MTTPTKSPADGSVAAHAEAGLARAAFIRRLPDIGRSAQFVHKVSARRCDNCGHGAGCLEKPPRRQRNRISGADYG